MLTAPYADYYARALALSGTASERVDAATDGVQIRALIAGRLRQAWQHYWWPETMREEERAYRDDYAAGTTYASGDEVYYPQTGAYYTALGATTGNAPTNAIYWAELTDLDPAEVGYAQTGKTAIGQVRAAYAGPDQSGVRLRRLPFILTGTGVRLLGAAVPRTVDLWFQLRPPELRGDAWATGSTYAIGDRVYFASGGGDYRGDFWECAASTTAGQSPSTHPAKWARVQLPRLLLEATAAGVAADMMRASGKFELAAQAEAMAERALYAEQGKQTALQGQEAGAARSVLARGLPVPSY